MSSEPAAPDRGAVVRDGRDGRPASAAPEPAPGSSRGWLWPASTIALAVLGVAAIVVAALIPAIGQGMPSDAMPAPSSPSPSVPQAATASPGATPSGSGIGTTPITELPDAGWVARTAASTGIPARALAAYAGASLAVASTRPGCHLGWNTLAGIGQVESAHGTQGGASIASNGVVVPTIVGPALDGSAGTAKVPDTDHGTIDGDSTWDHAVGPFQFVPGTWVKVAQDGNKDGVADINQIDDAALTAAYHLCEAGGDLAVAGNWINAMRAYNDAVDYVNRVADAANTYANAR